MSISTPVSRVDYIGSGSTAVYPYTYRIIAESDLLVTVRDTLNVETTYVLNVDYTVSGVGLSGGGNVTLLAGNLPVGYSLTIRRVRPLTQTTDVRNQGEFFPEIHEDAFDKGVMLTQQLQDQLDRSFKLEETEAGTTVKTKMPTATDRANRVLGFDASGNPIPVANVPTSGVPATPYIETLLDDPDAATARGTLGFPAGNGLVTKLPTSLAARTIAAGSGIGVTNGDGQSGNPTIASQNLADSNFGTTTTPITVSATAPVTPRIVGQMWFDTTTSVLRYWDGANWRGIGRGGLFQAVGAISAKQVVVADAGTPGRISTAAASVNSGNIIVGVAAEAIGDGNWGVVLTNGLAVCIAGAAITAGQMVYCSGAVAGRVLGIANGANVARPAIVGVAISNAAGAGNDVNVVVQSLGAVLGNNIAEALEGANSPSSSNPFSTKDDRVATETYATNAETGGDRIQFATASNIGFVPRILIVHGFVEYTDPGAPADYYNTFFEGSGKAVGSGQHVYHHIRNVGGAGWTFNSAGRNGGSVGTEKFNGHELEITDMGGASDTAKFRWDTAVPAGDLRDTTLAVTAIK